MSLKLKTAEKRERELTEKRVHFALNLRVVAVVICVWRASE